MPPSMTNSVHAAKIIHQNIRKPVRHGYYFEYRALQRLCIAILRADSNYFQKDSNSEVFGLLFDGAWLFEEYINTLIGDQYIHPQNTKGIGRQYLFNGGNGLIYPDFISRNRSNKKIADAKYKPINNIRGRDYLQLVAYLHRFEASEGYFIYPFQKSMNKKDEKILSLLSGVDETIVRDPNIKVIKLGIGIHSQESDFNTFEKAMLDEEAKLKNRMM